MPQLETPQRHAQGERRFVDSVLLKDQVALLIGSCGGGIATSTALALAEAGSAVVAVDISDVGVKETAELITSDGGQCLPLIADVRNMDELDNVYTAALDHFGKINSVINLVGGTRWARAAEKDAAITWAGIEDYSFEVFKQIFEVNLDYVFRSCQLAARHMIERGGGGSIVNFSSISSFASAPFESACGAAKAAVNHLTRTVAVELGMHGIRANCILPGAAPTPLQHDAYPKAEEEIERRVIGRSPLGRRLHPDEVARVVLFLVSDFSSGLTGQCLSVDAGGTANHPFGTRDEFYNSAIMRRREVDRSRA